MSFDLQQFYLSARGLLTRMQWWLGHPIFVITLVLAFINIVMGAHQQKVGVGILSGLIAVSLIPAIFVDIKRWHDRDKSGWWMLIVLLPIVGAIWFLIELGFLAGTPGANRFGRPPTNA